MRSTASDCLLGPERLLLVRDICDCQLSWDTTALQRISGLVVIEPMYAIPTHHFADMIG